MEKAAVRLSYGSVPYGETLHRTVLQRVFSGVLWVRRKCQAPSACTSGTTPNAGSHGQKTFWSCPFPTGQECHGVRQRCGRLGRCLRGCPGECWPGIRVVAGLSEDAAGPPISDLRPAFEPWPVFHNGQRATSAAPTVAQLSQAAGANTETPSQSLRLSEKQVKAGADEPASSGRGKVGDSCKSTRRGVRTFRSSRPTSSPAQAETTAVSPVGPGGPGLTILAMPEALYGRKRPACGLARSR